MNLNVYLENDLAQSLNQLVKKTHQPRNAIIREALRVWIINNQVTQWPVSILNYKGMPDFPSFESHRVDLADQDEDPFG